MAFTGFSFLLYCTKSSGWPGMTKLIGEWYHPQKYGRVWSILATSSRFSVVLATLFFGWLLSFMHWRTVAFIAAAFALVIFIGCYFYLKEKPEDPDFFKGLGTFFQKKYWMTVTVLVCMPNIIYTFLTFSVGGVELFNRITKSIGTLWEIMQV